MRYFIVTMLVLLLTSCATPHVVDVVARGDEELNCRQLENEVAKLDRFIKEAESEKGVTWSNVGRFILFPIGIWATYANANEAIEAANEREVYLHNIMGRKKCK